jgi:putative hemolysin
MDYWIIGAGFLAVSLAAAALVVGLLRFGKQQQAEYEETLAREAAKKSQPANNEGKRAGLANSAHLYGGLNGTTASDFDRSEK